MKLKPGKYVQRDGKIATVGAVDETKGDWAAIGWDSEGESYAWSISGEFIDGVEHPFDLIEEYKEPLITRSLEYRNWVSGTGTQNIAGDFTFLPTSDPRLSVTVEEFEALRKALEDAYATIAQLRGRVLGLKGSTVISNEALAALYIKMSGTAIHASDCSTSCAPAMTPGPCDCQPIASGTSEPVAWVHKAGGSVFYSDICAVLGGDWVSTPLYTKPQPASSVQDKSIAHERGRQMRLMELEALRSALKVIYTWADFNGGSELVPRHVKRLAGKALKINIPENIK